MMAAKVIPIAIVAHFTPLFINKSETKEKVILSDFSGFTKAH